MKYSTTNFSIVAKKNRKKLLKAANNLDYKKVKKLMAKGGYEYNDPDHESFLTEYLKQNNGDLTMAKFLIDNNIEIYDDVKKYADDVQNFELIDMINDRLKEEQVEMEENQEIRNATIEEIQAAREMRKEIRAENEYFESARAILKKYNNRRSLKLVKSVAVILSVITVGIATGIAVGRVHSKSTPKYETKPLDSYLEIEQEESSESLNENENLNNKNGIDNISIENENGEVYDIVKE